MLREIGKPAVEKLIEELGKMQVEANLNWPGWDERYASITFALAVIGEPAVEPLIKALGDDGDVFRMAAAMALGEIGDARAVQPLIEARGDEDGGVRKSAKDALKKLAGRKAKVITR